VCGALGESSAKPAPLPKFIPLKPVPLQTLVVNVTNQCNLACTYCYEYGEDKIVDTENGKQPKFMSEETAREAVEFALRESRDNPHAHITFFGGETLMNFNVLKSTIGYARRRAAEAGKDIDFSLTTNATLLRPEIIEFLATERVGVTISIDGPEEMQDKFRVFSNGAGSYAMAAPKIKALLARHRTRPIGARVTLTRQTLDVRKIYRHLTEELGFWEVGFAPVTTAPGRDYANLDGGFDHLLAQFRDLAGDFLEAALQNRHHGSRTSARRCRSFITVMPRRIRAAPASADGRVHRRQRRAVPPLRRLRRSFARQRARRRVVGQAAGLPAVASHQQQDRLLDLLGAADLRRRLLSRSAHALRIDESSQPALLRVDSRLDAHLPGDLRRDRREES
jgi:MoaA/NifB/PqqE/SkfB family radical SAM enzyme